MLAPSDFSALKNFVRKPVHENCSKFFQWFKITSNQLTVNDTKRVFFTNKKFFYLNLPVSSQNNRVWTGVTKADVKSVFSLSVRSLRSMWWSRLACVWVARDNSTLLMRALKWILRTMLAVSFPVLSLTALDCCPAHTARATQNWLQTNCPDFIAKDQWPPNSPDLNPLDYHVWGAMLKTYHKRHPKLKTIAELKDGWSGTAYLSDQ